MISTSTVAATSAWIRTVTGWAPTVLIGEGISIAAVDVGAARGLDGVSDVGDGHRAEEPAGLAGAGRQLHLERLELGLDLLRVADVLDLADLAGPLDGRDLRLGALGPADRVAAGHEVVAAVAVLDLDDVAGGTETGRPPG